MVSPPTPKASQLLGYGWGFAAPALCTLVHWPLRHRLGPASILLIYLLGVFLVATRYGRGPSILASLLSAPAFAFFFAPPIFSLAMKDLENVVGLGVMLVVANVTSNLVERLRRQAEISTHRERRATALYRLSEALAKADDERDIARISAQRIQAEFGTHARLLFPDAQGHLTDPLASPNDDAIPGADVAIAKAVFDSQQAKPAPECNDTSGARYFPLMGAAGVHGVLVLAPGFPWPAAEPGGLNFLAMFVGQIAQTAERIRLAGQARLASFQAESEALRNSLLSAISHDLRTPLTRIVGTASTLAEQDAGLTPAERHEFTQAIQDEAQHMAELMSKILDMARLTAGTIILHREWNTLEEIVGGTLSRLDAALGGRDVAIHLPDTLPLVRVDAVLLQQVLINLIDNAIKYSPSGTPIAISAEFAANALQLCIGDRGPGIPEHQREHLFKKFHRLTPESAQSGVGLGLALCRAIMEAHGGAISMSPRPDGGSQFILSLPLDAQEPRMVLSAWVGGTP